MNTYRGFNGQNYTAKPLEIFQCDSANGNPDWHVSGVESDSYYIGTFQSSPSDAILKREAEKIIRRKYDFIGEIEFAVQR